jgi:hypothetical protein
MPRYRFDRRDVPQRWCGNFPNFWACRKEGGSVVLKLAIKEGAAGDRAFSSRVEKTALSRTTDYTGHLPNAGTSCCTGFFHFKNLLALWALTESKE